MKIPIQILIVDGNLDRIIETKGMINLAIDNLNRGNFNLESSISTSTDVRTAFEQLNNNKYEIIFVGYNLGDGNIGGYELSQIIKRTYEHERLLRRVNDLNKRTYVVGNSSVWCGSRDFTDMSSAYEGIIDYAINPEIKDGLEKKFEFVIGKVANYLKNNENF